VARYPVSQNPGTQLNGKKIWFIVHRSSFDVHLKDGHIPNPKLLEYVKLETTENAMTAARKSEPVTTFEVVFPTDTNHYGTLFGGKLISWMDKAAYYAAIKFSGEAAVTASVERLDFGISLRQGDLVELEARVISTGTTSMVIKVDVFRIGLGEDADRSLTTTGFFTFVALNAKGKPQKLPKILVETGEEKELAELGETIRGDARARRRSGYGRRA